ncbi:MAG: hypothetical protein LBT47_07990 [Deltaproteobacteria bacterium]|nr:hypothetical protein [Deltaproteobacteria bacterium]
MPVRCERSHILKVQVSLPAAFGFEGAKDAGLTEAQASQTEQHGLRLSVVPAGLVPTATGQRLRAQPMAAGGPGLRRQNRAVATK